jgi:hypothetical protein
MPSGIVDLRPGSSVGRPTLVTASLDQFIASVRAVAARFPFSRMDAGAVDGPDDPAAARARAAQCDRAGDRAAEDLTEILRRIDRAAVADATTFWRSFVFDVQMGDVATEDVLSHRGQ